MRNDAGAEGRPGKGTRPRRDAIVITKILDRPGSYDSGFAAGDMEASPWTTIVNLCHPNLDQNQRVKSWRRQEERSIYGLLPENAAVFTDLSKSRLVGIPEMSYSSGGIVHQSEAAFISGFSRWRTDRNFDERDLMAFAKRAEFICT